MAYYKYKRRRQKSISALASKLSREEIEADLPELRQEFARLQPLYEHAKAESDRRAEEAKAKRAAILRLVEARRKLREDPASKIVRHGLIFSRQVLKDSVVEQIAEISRQLGHNDPETRFNSYTPSRSEDTRYVAPNGKEFESIDVALRICQFEFFCARKRLNAYERALQKYLTVEQREQREKQKKDIQRQRISELRAISAQMTGKARELATRTRSRLAATVKCPYCNGELLNPHADHIYPLSKGGLSVESNLVLVCAECNNRKANMTLRAFTLKFGLDRTAIEKRLLKLGKDV
jgi:5-methylcytosine-specific restriction endonuclease McrA